MTFTVASDMSNNTSNRIYIDLLSIKFTSMNLCWWNDADESTSMKWYQWIYIDVSISMIYTDESMLTIYIEELISMNLHICIDIEIYYVESILTIYIKEYKWIYIDELISIYIDELISMNTSRWSTLMNSHQWIYIYESILWHTYELILMIYINESI